MHSLSLSSYCSSRMSCNGTLLCWRAWLSQSVSLLKERSSVIIVADDLINRDCVLDDWRLFERGVFGTGGNF